MKNEIYKDEGYKLMGAAFEVYNEQRHGMSEEIYQESLEIELALRGTRWNGSDSFFPNTLSRD